MQRKSKTVNFIAVSARFVGAGETVDEAIDKLQEDAVDYDGDHVDVKDITVYQVQRYGHAKLTVEWVLSE